MFSRGILDLPQGQAGTLLFPHCGLFVLHLLRSRALPKDLGSAPPPGQVKQLPGPKGGTGVSTAWASAPLWGAERPVDAPPVSSCPSPAAALGRQDHSWGFVPFPRFCSWVCPPPGLCPAPFWEGEAVLPAALGTSAGGSWGRCLQQLGTFIRLH